MLILGIIGVLAALLLKDPRWLVIVFVMMVLRWWLWVRTTTAPFILLLSSSDPWSIELHRQTKLLVSPLRVVTLLDVGATPSSGAANEILLDCLRTGNDDDWWKVITILIDLTPLVVINADTESSRVVREARYIISKDATFKSVFLTKGGAFLLRRDPELAARASSCCVASASTLQGIITEMLDRAELPDRRRTVKSFISVTSNEGRLASVALGEGRSHSMPGSMRTEEAANKLLLESATCSQCNVSMTIFLGVVRKGVFPTKVFAHESHRGCFQCAACRRYYCWDCSDSRKPCSCGIKSWQEAQYFPAGVSPERALRGLL